MKNAVYWTILGLLAATALTVTVYMLFFWFGSSYANRADTTGIVVDDTFIHTNIVKGSDKTVAILLHSENWSSREYGNLLSQTSGNHPTMYVVDLPGYGLSDKPQARYNQVYYVNILDDLIDNVEAEYASSRIVLVGNSLTGRIALELANRNSAVNEVIWLNPFGVMEYTSRSMFTSQYPILPELLLSPLNPLLTTAAEQGWLTGEPISSFSDSELPNDVADSKFGRAKLHLLREAMNTLGVTTEYVEYTKELIDANAKPLTVVWGKGDEITPVQDLADAKQYFPNANIILTEGSHAVHTQNAKLVAKILNGLTK